MVNFDKSSCIHKFVGCRIDVDEQPEHLPSMNFTDPTDSSEYEEYYCPECRTGYFWDMTNEPWSCQPCNRSSHITNAHHCLQCPSAYRCTDCDQNFFPTYLEDGCMLPISNCQVTPSEYAFNNTHFFCP